MQTVLDKYITDIRMYLVPKIKKPAVTYSEKKQNIYKTSSVFEFDV